MGYVWRRLTAKCACTYATSKLAEFFSPVQVGVGVPGGCEAAVHAARKFVENMGADDVLVKLDFANAFNCLHRDHMLNIVKEFVPVIYCFCYSIFRYHSKLQFGSFTISSQVGPQQGDPLAGLLCCLAIQKLLRSTRSIFSAGYMDDIKLGVKVNDVSRDVELFKLEGEAIGLVLNSAKCEVISQSNILKLISSGPLKDLIAFTIEESTLLGAH